MHRFKVDKMGCGGRAKSVIWAIIGIKPDAQAMVDFGTKRVTVSAAAGPVVRIAQAIAAAGYPAELLGASA